MIVVERNSFRNWSWFRGNRGCYLSFVAVLALTTLLTGPTVPTPVTGQTSAALTPYVVRIEEDWSLKVNQPNASLSCPQVSTQMAPNPSGTQFYQFHVNSQDVPQFVQGGLQLQAWNGSTTLAVLTGSNTATMATANELVTWTQYLQRHDTGGLTFGITAAASQTWGDFSGAKFYVTGADIVLDNYRADYSVQNSGATYGVNLVSSLVLVQTRVYYSDGSVKTDSTVRVVY
jgi:hypothetical protein